MAKTEERTQLQKTKNIPEINPHPYKSSADRAWCVQWAEDEDLPLSKYPPGMRTERRDLPFQFGDLAALGAFLESDGCIELAMARSWR